MPGRIRSVTGHRRETLVSGWELASSPAGTCADLTQLQSFQWLSIDAPTTAAAALRMRKAWSLDNPAPRRFDAEDWWYRVEFSRPAAEPERANIQTVLGFDGLATVADAWLNGQPLFSSDNMFVAHEIPIDGRLQPTNELVLRFRSLDTLLTAKRPRPRWRTPMIENQQLRWFRTTLLGRTPGWSPPAAAVGPWRPVWLETRHRFQINSPRLCTRIDDTAGIVEIECEINGVGAPAPEQVELHVSRDGADYRIRLTRQEATRFHGHLTINDVELWWPHTHGKPALYQARLLIEQSVEVDLGRIGFRTVTLDKQAGNFALSINDVPVFCRGACWTPPDCVALSSDKQTLDTALDQIVAAGMNMLRVGGTMVYESDDFLDACDAHGILLWQEFMFANMDYPQGDAAFDASVRLEAEQLLQRLAGRPSLTVLCGNSEGEQQAAMWGAAREQWSPPLFHSLLPQLTGIHAPDVPYWPSSAHGGAFPHQGNSGTTSYYGVGAYRRPPTDARHAELRFATECLAFANVPEERTLAAMPGGLSVKVHHPQWKSRSPRDLGAGWDFDDVRDHYLAEVFRVAPLDLRYADHERYLQLSRLAAGEIMAGAFREWRRKRSTCNGALVWFLRDLWPGAGWGIVDALGAPKSGYYFLKRVLQPRTAWLSDEGGNGIFIHVANEKAQAMRGTLELWLYRAGEILLVQKRREITVPARETLELPAADLLEGFMDLNYAYRFGPPACDLIVATFSAEDDAVLAQDFYFPTGQSSAVMEPDIGLTANARILPEGDALLTIQTKRLARFVMVQADGFEPEDQYFHISPGARRQFRLRRLTGAATAVKGQVQALNCAAVSKITTA